MLRKNRIPPLSNELENVLEHLRFMAGSNPELKAAITLLHEKLLDYCQSRDRTFAAIFSSKWRQAELSTAEQRLLRKLESVRLATDTVMHIAEEYMQDQKRKTVH